MSRHYHVTAPHIKKYNNEYFFFHEYWYTLENAQEEANELRKKGYLVRLSKHKSYRDDPRPQIRIYKRIKDNH